MVYQSHLRHLTTLNLATQIHALSLVRETAVDAKRWIYESRDTLLLVNLVQFLHVFLV